MFRLQAASEDDTICLRYNCASSDVSKAVPVGAGAVLFLFIEIFYSIVSFFLGELFAVFRG